MPSKIISVSVTEDMKNEMNLLYLSPTTILQTELQKHIMAHHECLKIELNPLHQRACRHVLIKKTDILNLCDIYQLLTVNTDAISNQAKEFILFDIVRILNLSSTKTVHDRIQQDIITHKLTFTNLNLIQDLCNLAVDLFQSFDSRYFIDIYGKESSET